MQQNTSLISPSAILLQLSGTHYLDCGHFQRQETALIQGGRKEQIQPGAPTLKSTGGEGRGLQKTAGNSEKIDGA